MTRRPCLIRFSMALLIALLAASAGCRRVTPDQIVTSAAGTDRLVLNFVGPDSGRDFHSLVWQVRDDDGWTPRVTITRAGFQAGRGRLRWVSELHALDAVRGVAIIKVAEGDVPEGSPSIRYAYSWRSWDLTVNRQIEVLQVCASPFDPYADPAPADEVPVDETMVDETAADETTADGAGAPPEAASLHGPVFVVRSVSIHTNLGDAAPIPVPDLLGLSVPVVLHADVLDAPTPTEAATADLVTIHALPARGGDGGSRYSHAFLQSCFQAISDAHTDTGLIGIFVAPDEAALAAGDLVVTVEIARIAEIATLDMRNGQRRHDAPDLGWVVTESPLQIGDLIRRSVLEDFLDRASDRVGAPVDVSLEAAADEDGIRVTYVVGAD